MSPLLSSNTLEAKNQFWIKAIMRNKSPQAVPQPHRRSPRKSNVTPSKTLHVLNVQDNAKSDNPSRKVFEKEGILSPRVVSNNEIAMGSDSLGLGSCIRCNKRDGQLLVCGGNACLISVHEKCLGCGPKFDDSGRFRCPLCEQKVAAALVMETRRKVVEAKRALSIFLEGTVDVEGEKRAGDGVEVENRDTGSDGKRKTRTGRKGSGHPGRVQTVLENEIRQRSFDVDGGGDGNVGSSGDGRREGIETGRLETVEEEKGDDDIAEETGKNVGKTGEDVKEVQPEASDEIENDEDEVSDTEKLVRRPKRFKQRAGKMENRVEEPLLRRKSVAKKSASASYEKANTRSKSKAASTNLIATFVQEKRKRLHWNEDEEETLMKYIKKYSGGTSNIPWRKILDKGSRVFHNTRVPGDLRDKWRKMIRRG